MGFTLEELKLIKNNLRFTCKNESCPYCSSRRGAGLLIDRAIRFKEVNMITGRNFTEDVKGNPINESN